MQWLIIPLITRPVTTTLAPARTMLWSSVISSYVLPSLRRIRQPGSTPGWTCPCRTTSGPPEGGAMLGGAGDGAALVGPAPGLDPVVPRAQAASARTQNTVRTAGTKRRLAMSIGRSSDGPGSSTPGVVRQKPPAELGVGAQLDEVTVADGAEGTHRRCGPAEQGGHPVLRRGAVGGDHDRAARYPVGRFL